MTEQSQQATILDLGAGNGWLSYRLATLGHPSYRGRSSVEHLRWIGCRHALPAHPCQSLFPRFQAELDRLPFGDGQFDCAIFNASFHYSENYDVTLAEAIRCLRPGGTVCIADSPSYSREESGLHMLEERRKSFQARFGFQSDALASCEYLTKERLLSLEAKHDLEWTTHQAWYGIRWACRPIIARLYKTARTFTISDLHCASENTMIILFNPRATKPRNRRFPLSVMALAAVLEGREEYRDCGWKRGRQCNRDHSKHDSSPKTWNCSASP